MLLYTVSESGKTWLITAYYWLIIITGYLFHGIYHVLDEILCLDKINFEN